MARLTWPLGRRSLVAMLRGSVSAPKSARASTAFGLLESASDAEVKRWITALVASGALVEFETEDGYRVLRAEPGATVPSLGPRASGPVDGQAEGRLRVWRRDRSQADGVPAYVIFPDATLRELAATRPETMHELAAVKGFGPARIERYGDEFWLSSRRDVLPLDCLTHAILTHRGPEPRTGLQFVSCGCDEARRSRASGAGFGSCVSSQWSPSWWCSRGWRSHSVWFALSRARSLNSTLQPNAREVDGVVYASNGESVLTVLRGDESRVLLKNIRFVSPIMRQAIVSVEDRRFYEHNGVDTRGIARALWQDIQSQAVVEGGSTITQQFVKNAYVRNEKTLARKVREAALAWQLEQRWPKDRILLAYLNTIYFGNGAYGIQQAARTYFDKGAKKLTLPEAALLAGLPADPSLYDPTQHPRAAKQRRHFVLRTMFEQGKITARQLQTASDAPLPKAEDVRLPGTQGPAQYFVNYVKDQLIAQYGAGRVFGGGLKVTSTIDLGLQETARKAIDSVLKTPNGPSAALVAIDPRTGAVKAMVGGSNFRESQFNLATQAERQPGSSFKPIVLASALRQGISPQTMFESKPVEIDAGDRVWRVTNYEDAYLGRVDLARAMVSSDNSVYAQLTKLVGPKAIVKTAHALGIRSELDPYFSIGLGAVAVNPLDMTRAYATFANRGVRVDGSLSKIGDRPRVIEKVEFARTGRVSENRPVGKATMTTSQADLLTSILGRVVTTGTGKRAALVDRLCGRQDGDDRQLR